MKHYLSDDARVVYCHNFESGIVNVLGGNCDLLSEKQVSIFTKEVILGSSNNRHESDSEGKEGQTPKDF